MMFDDSQHSDPEYHSYGMHPDLRDDRVKTSVAELLRSTARQTGLPPRYELTWVRKKFQTIVFE